MWRRLQAWWKLLGRRRRRVLRVIGAFCMVILLLNGLFPPPVPAHYSATLTDAHGRLLYTQLTPDEKWRLQLQPDDISPLMEKAILYKEDRWFYYHPGINPLAVVRALWRNMVRGKTTSGASTITMQLARMMERRPRNLWSKIAESCRALQLEVRYSKKQILTWYLNMAPYGGNIEGIRSAAFFYLQKEPELLSLAEITALSIIPNRPNSLTPGRHNDAIVAERNRWLAWYRQKGYFEPQMVADAQAEPWHATRMPPPRQAPHLARRLMTGGQTNLTTTVEANLQLLAEKLLADHVRSMRLLGIQNGAVLVVRNADRKVLAYVGSAGFTDTADAGQVDGIRAIRQPGSTLKPLVYGLAIDAGLITPKLVIADVPVNYRGYVPENYDQTFKGQVTVEQALMQSLNIPAVNTLQHLGKEKLIQALVNSGFKQVHRDRKKLGLSMALGGCGTSLEELTGLFCAIASNGDYVPLQYTQTAATPAPIRILSPQASYMLHEILSKIDRPDLPLNWGATENLPRIAWKTGTSYGRRDAWSIGYNQAYTIGVWMGNFSGKGVPALSGATIATPLLFRLFNSIDRQSHTKWYEPPAGFEQRMVCAETGMPPAPFCNQLIMDYFVPLVSANEVCQNRKEIVLSANGRWSHCNHCMPASGYQKKWFKVLPPDIAAFNLTTGADNEPIPPHYPYCDKVAEGSGPAIVSPQHLATYYLSQSHPQPLALECTPAADVAVVHWYINDKLFKTSPGRQKVFYLPAPGRQKISCTDDKGRTKHIFIEVMQADF